MIFDSVDLRLGHGDRIGLIGPNGSGKTSLLRVIAGDQEIDDGKVVRAKGIRVGWLPQELVVAGGRSLRDFILSSVPGRTELDRELAEAEAALGAPGTDEELIEAAERVAELHERIDHFERFFGEHEALSILAGLGFQPGEEDRDLGELSGGWNSSAPTCCSSTSRPTTSTCRRLPGSRTSSRSGIAASCSSATIASS